MEHAECYCECGERFGGYGSDEFTALQRAYAKRTQCREANPDFHRQLRAQYDTRLNFVKPAPPKASPDLRTAQPFNPLV